MAKKKTVNANAVEKVVTSTFQFENPVTEFIHAERLRKISFSDTCEKIESWGRSAAAAYLDGKSPSPEQVQWLVSLVKRLSTGTKETKILRVTTERIAKLVELEMSSMTPYVKEWKSPIVKQSGRRKAQYNLMKILPTLKKQFPDINDDAWNGIIAESVDQ